MHVRHLLDTLFSGEKMKNNQTVMMMLVLGSSLQAIASTPVIYGEDGRKDIYEVRNPQQVKLAESTVALMGAESLVPDSSGNFFVKAKTLMDSQKVCKDEKFANQPVAAFCSGFLVSKNIVVTAGHCVTDQNDCSKVKLVFGFGIQNALSNPKIVKASEVYECKTLIHREQTDNGADFAVLELNRDVTNHAPLALNKSKANSTIENGTKLLLIGYPSGLPAKIADGASVRDSSFNGFFRANTDSYGGNSGSAVFNSNSGEIEGILVRGERDYEPTAQGCARSKVCTEDGCRGEDVTKISAVIPYLAR